MPRNTGCQFVSVKIGDLVNLVTRGGTHYRGVLNDFKSVNLLNALSLGPVELICLNDVFITLATSFHIQIRPDGPGARLTIPSVMVRVSEIESYFVSDDPCAM